MPKDFNEEISAIYKAESGKVLASLIRILGDFDLAEEALHESFTIALKKWPVEGIPKNPYSWLVSTGKFKSIDAIRRTIRGRELAKAHFSRDEQTDRDKYSPNDLLVDDDLLRLIFLCCHPDLSLDSRIALSLKEVCGLATSQIAQAYFTSSDTIKKRISRAKAFFKKKNIPFEIPTQKEIETRIGAVLHVIYLIFNEGYSTSSGEVRIRKELTDEAIFLGRKVTDLVATPESFGLLALLLIQESRRGSRVTESGEPIALEDQDRGLWDRLLIQEGMELIQKAIMSGRLGAYTLQAAIASVHATADSVQNTRWDLIIDYYDLLLSINPSPVIELNRAIAVGMYRGPAEALDIINPLTKEKSLKSYHLIYSAQADFLRRLGKKEEARKAYEIAINLTGQIPEKRYLENQMKKL